MMNSTKIIRSLGFSNKFLTVIKKSIDINRTFLSESYACQEAWNNRLKSPLLSQFKPINLFLEADQKFQTGKKVSAVDIDIFANIIQDHSHVDEIADLLYKLRNTRETSFTLDSTHHAVIRYYISVGEAEQLLTILNDRLNYGIFSDYLCYNLLMDHFIKKDNFASAAKVATYFMLQEQFENPINNALALYSCHKYLENPDTWQEEDPEVIKKREEPKEEIKIRVKYLDNPYFDDHFDLWKPSDLVGKTLFWIGLTMNNTIGRSCQLRGMILYRKFEDAIRELKKWKEEKIKEVIHKDVLSLIKKDVPEVFVEEADEQLKELQQLLLNLENDNLYQVNLEEDLIKLIEKAIEIQSEEDKQKQIELYDEWEVVRQKIYNEQLESNEIEKRLSHIEDLKKDLIDRERTLTFFENEEEIELQIQEKLENEKLIYGDETQETKDLEENYVSPEILRKRR